MNRPKVLHVGGVLYWVMRIRNPDTQVLKDADSTPTVVIRKNGASTGDSVTVTKRSATTGIYDCSYNPAGEVEGDEFTVEETATVTGTTTAQATYSTSWEFTVIAVERGTDGANTTAPANSTIADISSRIPATLEGGRIAAVLDPTVGAEITGIKAKTDNLPSDPADQSLIIAATDAVMARLGAPAGASVSADVAAVKSDTASLLLRLTANAATAIQNLWHMITGTGASSKFTVAALENGPVGAGGSGDWTDTEKEQIRYRLGLDGDTSAPADPDTDPIVVTPGSGDLTTGYTTTLGTDGEAIEGIFVRWRLVDVPTGTGLALDSSASEAESDSNGLVQLAGLVKGATYLIWRGTNERDGITVTIPSDASSTYELPNIAGP